MKTHIFAWLVAACALAVSAFAKSGDDQKTPYESAVTVFKAGDGNPYASIRIPAIVNAGGKMLVAFAEGRYQNTDQGKNDLIVSISKDDGKTWSKPTVAAEAKGATFNNPYPIYDSETKQIILFFQCYPPGVHEQGKNKPAPGWKDPKSLRNFVTTSTNGKKWSKPVDVTETTKHEDAVLTCSGPNPGVQLTRGKHAGRLVVVFNEAPHFGNWHLTAAYSDDHGKTWKLGEKSASNGGINEVSVVETEDGGIFVVSRTWGSSDRRRVAYSADGGETWGEISGHNELPSFNCQNGLVRYSFADDEARGGKNRILFSAPGEGGRKSGIIKMSYDDGKTWPVEKRIGPGPYAYSALCPLKPGHFGVLFEVNGSPLREIRFARVSMDWLTDGKDSGKKGK